MVWLLSLNKCLHLDFRQSTNLEVLHVKALDNTLIKKIKLVKFICCIFSCASALELFCKLSFCLSLVLVRLKSAMKTEEDCVFSWFSFQAKQGGRSEYRNVNLTLLKIKIKFDVMFCVLV